MQILIVPFLFLFFIPKTSDQYVTLLKAYLQQPEWQSYSCHRDGPFGYDAVWAIGLMLHKAVRVLNMEGKKIEEFTYDDERMGQLFFELLNQTSFIGVSVSLLQEEVMSFKGDVPITASIR